MAAYIGLLESAVFLSLRQFLLRIFPAGTEVVRAMVNRVPMPVGPNFAEMAVLRRARLGLNTSSLADIVLTGSIAGTTLTVTAIEGGPLHIGLPIRGPTVVPGTMISAALNSNGGVGTYQVSAAQEVPSGQLIAGARYIRQPTQVDIQVDIYGPSAAQNTQVLSTLFRDEYGVVALSSYETTLFGNSGEPLVDSFGIPVSVATFIDTAALYTSDARRLPFINAEQQFEDRWSIDLSMQINPLVIVPQDFAAALEVTSIIVDASALQLATSVVSVETS